jgi:hypothetical protein
MAAGKNVPKRPLQLARIMNQVLSYRPLYGFFVVQPFSVPYSTYVWSNSVFSLTYICWPDFHLPFLDITSPLMCYACIFFYCCLEIAYGTLTHWVVFRHTFSPPALLESRHLWINLSNNYSIAISHISYSAGGCQTIETYGSRLFPWALHNLYLYDL